MTKVIKGSGRNGDFVLNTQKTGSDQGFKHVSQEWLNKGTLSYEQGLEELEKGRAQAEDLELTIKGMVPTVSSGRFCFKAKDGREFTPTMHALKQIGEWAGTGSWYLHSLMGNPTDRKGRQLYARDEDDAYALKVAISNGLRRLEKNKVFLWRVRQDGTLRAMLSDRYARVDNRWFIETMREIIPGGRLSHWKGDSDTLWGNILIPDSIRAETDSDYGGMVSVGNSEIGERRVSSMPSLFRAICRNGCIWDQQKGAGLINVHRGTIDLAELKEALKKNVGEQIPLIPARIEALLDTRKYIWDGDSVRPLFVQLSHEAKLTLAQTIEVMDGYNRERAIAPESARSLFGVVAAMTRAAQDMSNDEWVRLDTMAGKIVEDGEAFWRKLSSRAKSLSVHEVDSFFGVGGKI